MKPIIKSSILLSLFYVESWYFAAEILPYKTYVSLKFIERDGERNCEHNAKHLISLSFFFNAVSLLVLVSSSFKTGCLNLAFSFHFVFQKCSNTLAALDRRGFFTRVKFPHAISVLKGQDYEARLRVVNLIARIC